MISSSLSQNDIDELVEDETDCFTLSTYNNEEMTHMVHVALYLRRLILDHDLNKNAELTEENAYASVPEALYVFMAIMHGGSDILDSVPDENLDGDNYKFSKLRKSILDVCQDLIYSISGGKNVPPKQYTLGLTIHQMSDRNKKLV